MTEDLKEQIRKAQAEMATWSEGKRKSVRLEGADLWLSNAAPSYAPENPLLDVLKHALGLLTLHGHEEEARKLGSAARLAIAASAPREKT